MHSHHALLPVLLIPTPKIKIKLLLTSVTFAIIHHSTPYDSRPRRRQGEITYNEPGSSRLSSYRHGVCLSILLKIRWGILRYTFAFLDCSLPSFQVEKKITWDFGQFCGVHGTGLGFTEDQWYLGPLHTR